MSEALVPEAIGTLVPTLIPAAFVILAVWEALKPARINTAPLTLRWFGNAAVFVLGWPFARLLPFLSVTFAALFARKHGLGLFNTIQISPVIAIAVSVLALDLVAYWEHRLVHFFGPFWRLHALHHTDTDLDVATYIRQHPAAVLLHVVLDAVVTITFGFSALTVALYAAIAGFVQMVAHANIEIPAWLRWLGMLMVTPEFHRLHHSRRFDENNANFSEAFPFWDHLFGTARIQRSRSLEFGLPEFIETKFHRLDRMLLLPLLVRPAGTSSQSAELGQRNP